MQRPFTRITGKRKHTLFGVFDIETWGFSATDKDFALGVVNLGHGDIHRFSDREEMVAFMTGRQCRGYTLFAHNMSKFDGLCLFGDPSVFFGAENVLLKGGKWIVAKYKQGTYDYKGEKRQGKYTVQFADSLNIFESSVEKIGEKLGYPKGHTPEKFINATHEAITEEDFMYCEQDTEIIYRAIETLQNELNELRVTAPSIAMHYFQRNFLEGTYFVNRELDDLFHSAYYGGRVEAYKLYEITPHNWTYDINSLYPWVMYMGYFPNPNKIRRLSNPTINQLIAIMGEYEGMARVTVKHAKSKICYLPYKREDGKVIFPHGEFVGSYCFPELRYALQTGKLEIESIDYVIYGERMESPFKAFIAKIYPLKQNGEGFIREVYKKIMNALYGKFCENHSKQEWYSERFDSVMFEKLQKDFPDVTWNPLGAETERGYYRAQSKEEDTTTNHTIYAWGSYITSMARCENAKWQDKIRELGIDCYYTDTDSFVTSGELPQEWVSSTELGLLKCEDKPPMHYIHGNKDYTRVGGVRQTKGVARGKANKPETTGYHPITRIGNVFQFTRLVGVKEARRNSKLKYGQAILITKALSSKYDKRIVGEDGETESCRVVITASDT